ncbi:hypothetical protein BC828DRAFT_360620 [Blastocladiella britannica]|nr:hypothetical protein BC828DRAFT_360620 [Blastocladiella britannica]
MADVATTPTATSVPAVAAPSLVAGSAAPPAPVPVQEQDQKHTVPALVLASPSLDPTFSPSYPINAPPTDRPVRIYCDGIYDLFHYGHARALQQAKQAFPDVYLLVGVCSDRETHARKGKTVMTDTERYQSVSHCRWVDEVVEDAPWFITQEFLDKYAIDYVAHDDIPYESGDCKDVYAFVKNQGKFFPTKRTDGVSTSDMITRIVRDYDKYLRRNLARGVSPRDLNIGFFKKTSLSIEKGLEEFRNEVRDEVKEWRDEWRETVRTWEDKSSQYVKGFMNVFNTGVKMLRRGSPGNSRPSSPRRRRTRSEYEADDGTNANDDDDDDDDDDDARFGVIGDSPPYLYATSSGRIFPQSPLSDDGTEGGPLPRFEANTLADDDLHHPNGASGGSAPAMVVPSSSAPSVPAAAAVSAAKPTKPSDGNKKAVAAHPDAPAAKRARRS